MEAGPALPVRRHHIIVGRVVQQPLVIHRFQRFGVRRVDVVRGRFPLGSERVQVARRKEGLS